MKPVKCEICGSPLEITFQSHSEERFRCTMCGRQIRVEIAEKERKSEETGDIASESTD